MEEETKYDSLRAMSLVIEKRCMQHNMQLCSPSSRSQSGRKEARIKSRQSAAPMGSKHRLT
jgi:hypothetical protein